MNVEGFDPALVCNNGCAWVMTLKDGNAEFTGIKFLADGKSFLVHLQHRTQESCTVPNTTDELWVSGFHIDKAE
jgi:secreted PhoX family phosphatase